MSSKRYTEKHIVKVLQEIDTETSATGSRSEIIAGQTTSFVRDGAYVTDPVIGDNLATYTPGISERRGGTTRYTHSGLKNTGAQSTNAIVATRVYDAYGAVRSFTGSWAGPFGYAGGYGYQEDETGLRLLGHRYYDASTGRFLTRDPIKDGRNWYSYCDGDPINGVDPAGFQETEFTKNGREWHKLIQEWYKKKYRKNTVFTEQRLLNGMRPDIVDYNRRLILEIKPDNARSVKLGEKQIMLYADALGFDRGVIVVYPEKTSPKDFKDPMSVVRFYPGHRNVMPK